MVPVWTWAATCSSKQPEQFVSFLPTFSESKGFALQRTVLPLPLLNWSGGVDIDGKPLSGPQKTYLSAAEYWRWPTLSKFIEDKELQPDVRRQTASEAIVDLAKEGVEGVVTFHFKTQGGCWYLWQYEVRVH